MWQRGFQGNPAFRLKHGYCWLLLAKFTVRIVSETGIERLEKLTVCSEKKLGPRNIWLLKSNIGTINRSQALCMRRMGKMS
jgi:hypothetical protein